MTDIEMGCLLTLFMGKQVMWKWSVRLGFRRGATKDCERHISIPPELWKKPWL